MRVIDSLEISDLARIERYISDLDFPYLISFPRTGSHWLRMIMELYFEKPSLVRVFYYGNAHDFTCLHHHDLNLSLERRRVIYLYREPAHTVFSQIKYEKGDHHDSAQIAYWSELYGKHLSKWLSDEKFTSEKIILKYEDMVYSMNGVFQALSGFMGETFKETKLATAVGRVTREEVKKRTRHDTQVMNLSSNYVIEREEFEEDHSRMIRKIIFEINPSLKNVF